MLYKANELRGFKLEALDGEIGKCRDFLFDDNHWTIRYMDARTGSWLTGARVLISPVALREPDWEREHFPVNLTREQLRNCPPIAEDQPVSKRYEASYFQYFGYGYYWTGDHVWGMGAYPYDLQESIVDDNALNEEGDEHLRSVKEVTGYDVYADGEKVGSVDGFLVENDSWVLRYMVVDTGNWLSHHRVVIPPSWVTEISWPEHKVQLSLRKEQIEAAPEYDDSGPVTREYEEQYFKHYGQDPYWS